MGMSVGWSWLLIHIEGLSSLWEATFSRKVVYMISSWAWICEWTSKQCFSMDFASGSCSDFPQWGAVTCRPRKLFPTRLSLILMLATRTEGNWKRVFQGSEDNSYNGTSMNSRLLSLLSDDLAAIHIYFLLAILKVPVPYFPLCMAT